VSETSFSTINVSIGKSVRIPLIGESHVQCTIYDWSECERESKLWIENGFFRRRIKVSIFKDRVQAWLVRIMITICLRWFEYSWHDYDSSITSIQNKTTIDHNMIMTFRRAQTLSSYNHSSKKVRLRHSHLARKSHWRTSCIRWSSPVRTHVMTHVSSKFPKGLYLSFHRPSQMGTVSLEKLSSSKSYEGELIKYKFKVISLFYQLSKTKLLCVF